MNHPLPQLPPTSQSSQWALWLGDCRRVLSHIPDQSIDLILTDPPYNLRGYSTGNIELSWRKDINNDLAEWDGLFSPTDYAGELFRVLKPEGNIFIFCTYNLVGLWHGLLDPQFDTCQFMVWHKTNPVPKFYRKGFLNSCELIMCAWNKNHIWNFGKQKEMHNFIETPICMGNERVKNPSHPTQKPVEVLKHIISLATQPGALVLDPFMGVGSTGVAARDLERNFWGVEIDPAYFEVAERRLSPHFSPDS